MTPRRSLRRRRAVTALGVFVLVAAAIGTYVSYNASRGLPLTPGYRISVELPDAARLNQGTSEVRIGGARVGIVAGVEAVPGERGRPPVARVELSLAKSVERLPVDSVAQVRPRSILGAKYLDLQPGTARRGVPPGGVLPAKQARPAAEFDEAFQVWDEETTRALRSTIRPLGDGLTARGTDVNRTIGSLRALAPPLERVMRTLGAPETELDGLVEGTAATTVALAAVAPQLGSLVDRGATTLAAVARESEALGRTIGELPRTEAVGTRALRRARPVLGDALAITRELRTATPLLPGTSRRVASTLGTGTRVLGALQRGQVVQRLGPAVDALHALVTDPAARPALRSLLETVTTLKTTLDELLPAQSTCNVAAVWARNLGDVMSGGDDSGNWLNVLVVFDTSSPENQMFLSPKPHPELHVNPYPSMNARECEAGNEPYQPGQRIGNPAGEQRAATEETQAPAAARELARRAGLLEAAR